MSARRIIRRSFVSRLGLWAHRHRSDAAAIKARRPSGPEAGRRIAPKRATSARTRSTPCMAPDFNDITQRHGTKSVHYYSRYQKRTPGRDRARGATLSSCGRSMYGHGRVMGPWLRHEGQISIPIPPVQCNRRRVIAEDTRALQLKVPGRDFSAKFHTALARDVILARQRAFKPGHAQSVHTATSRTWADRRGSPSKPRTQENPIVIEEP